MILPSLILSFIFVVVLSLSYTYQQNNIHKIETIENSIAPTLKIAISSEMEKIKNISKDTTLHFFILYTMQFIVSILLIFIGFYKIYKIQERANRKLIEKKKDKKMIDDYLKLIDKNVITSATDLEGNITYASEHFCFISGYTKEELIGTNHRIVKHPDMDIAVFTDMWDTINQDKTWTGEIKNLKKDGGFYWVDASISPLYDVKNIKIGYTAIRQDITDKKRIEEISITDALTDIYNRRFFNEVFPKMVRSAKRNEEMLCFMLIDIDNFKSFNDTYGHQMGDRVIQSVARVLRHSLHRADDMCFRLGGEEFGVLCKVMTEEKGSEFGDKIRRNIENLGFMHKHNTPFGVVTISMGLIVLNAKYILSCEDIYKKADDLLYESKRNGRNKITVNEPPNLISYIGE